MKEQDPKKLINYQKEAGFWTNKASGLAKKHKLLNRLGIVDGVDSRIFNEYLAIRLIREKVYKDSRLLSSPLTSKAVKMPIVGSWVKRLDNLVNYLEEVSQYQEQATNQFAQEHYLTEDQLRKGITIELAVNDLITKATTFNTKTPRSEPQLTPDLLNDWEQNWRSKIEYTEV